MKGFLIALVLAAGLMPLVSRAASGGAWDSLAQLRKGQKIQVVQMDWKSTEGRFVNVSNTAITLSRKATDITVAREDVLRVTLKERSKRLRNALLGAAIGAGAGIAIGAATDRGLHEPGEGNFGKKMFGLIGVGAGAGTGAAIASHPTLYRAPAPRRK